MSRSRKKFPIGSITCIGDRAGTEAKAKRKARRAWRRRLHMLNELEEEEAPLLKELSDIWDFPKDGKHFSRHWPWSELSRRK